MAKQSQKLKVDLDPQDKITFDWPIKIPTAKGELAFNVTYLYRSRTELAELGEARVERAKARYEKALADQKAAAAEAKSDQAADDQLPAEVAKLFDIKFVENLIGDMDQEVESLLEVLVGWDIAYPFSEENLRRLCDRYHAAAKTLTSQYTSALNEGRLGNFG